MKKIYLLQLLAVILMVLAGCAKTDPADEVNPSPKPVERIVTESQAKAFAEQAFSALQSFDPEAPMTRAAGTRSAGIEVDEVITLSSNGIPAMYIVNFSNEGGYMGISADKEQSNPMVMLSDVGRFDLSMLNEDSPFSLYLNERMEVISENIMKNSEENPDRYSKWDYLGDVYINEKGEEISTTIELVSVASLSHDVRLEAIERRKAESPETRGCYRVSKKLDYISPGIVAAVQWGQTKGYNADAPRPNVDAAGCAAVAIAQLCFYHEFPEIYDYHLMPFWLPKNTTTSTPISKMLRSVGNKIPGYSWGLSTGATESGMLACLKTLGYSAVEKADYDFYRTYYNMKAGYPVVLIANSNVGGHAWLCNGYQEMVWKVTIKTKFLGVVIRTHIYYEYADYLYMNWGWYGSGNTWVDQEEWISKHPTSGDIAWNSLRRAYYDLVPNRGMIIPKDPEEPKIPDPGGSVQPIDPGTIVPRPGGTLRPIKPDVPTVPIQ